VDSEIYLSGRERRADGRGLTLPVRFTNYLLLFVGCIGIWSR
jgi:hypothetical protein